MSAPAQAVDPTRIPLQDSAGVTRPEQLLAPERAHVLQEYHKMELPKSMWPAEPVGSCRWVNEKDEAFLWEELIAAGMVDFVATEAACRLCGKPTVAGLFAVLVRPAYHRPPAGELDRKTAGLGQAPERCPACTLSL